MIPGDSACPSAQPIVIDMPTGQTLVGAHALLQSAKQWEWQWAAHCWAHAHPPLKGRLLNGFHTGCHRPQGNPEALLWEQRAWCSSPSAALSDAAPSPAGLSTYSVASAGEFCWREAPFDSSSSLASASAAFAFIPCQHGMPSNSEPTAHMQIFACKLSGSTAIIVTDVDCILVNQHWKGSGMQL